MHILYKRRYLAIAIAAGCLNAAPGSLAQGFTEEVVVTAAKRQQTLQDIPIAVSVTSAETIEQAAIVDINDLQSVVPSLRVTQLQSSNNTSFAIRGFANGTNNQGIESSVGIFIDGVYRSRGGAAISDLPRLERVEVLSGPQSTLFGKNASAGVISVVTPAPSGETGGYISAGISNYSGYSASGLFESAISDDLSFDISAHTNVRDGYFDNSFDGSEQNERDRWGIRGQLYFTPTESTSIRVIADYDEIDEVCCGTTNLLSGPTEGAVRFVGGQLVPNDPYSRDSYLDVTPFNEIENGGISVQLDIEFDDFTFTSITAQRMSDVFKDVDIDYTSADLSSDGQQDLELDTFTQEFRLTSNGEGSIDWMIGAFYFQEDLEFTDNVIWGDDARGYFDALVAGLGAPGALSAAEAGFGFPAGTFFASGTGLLDAMTQDDESYSFFGQVDFHLSEDLTVTMGLNYTQAEKEVEISQINTNTFAFLPTELLGALAPLQLLPPIVALPNSVEDNTTDDDDVTYTLRLAYNLTEEINVYISTNTGFKASSWNLSRDTLPNEADLAALTAAGLTACCVNLQTGQRFAGPEESTVYEIGLKAQFERVSVNIAIFDQEIEGFQSAIFNGTGYDLLNAGKQSTEGVEFDVVYYPVDPLKLTFSGILLDPVYDSFKTGTNAEGVPDLSGEQPAGIHEVSLSLSATYSFPLGSSEAYIRGDYQYEDEVQAVDNVAASLASREVKLFNMSAGMTTPDGWDFSVWGKNLTDEDYLLTAFPTPAQEGSFNGYPNQPRTYGLRVRKNF
jgi:outer membrane receptor protein involved in Fe transport